MEPSGLYNHSKRNLIVFSAILALVLFGVVEAKDSTQIFGFKIQPSLVPTVLFFVVAYLLYQFFLAQTFQVDEVRQKIKIDFVVTVILCGVVLTGYLVFHLFHQILGYGLSTAAVFAPIVVSAIAIALFLYRGADLLKWRREAMELREDTIEKRLKEPGWILNYNPKLQRGTKEISFNDDGSIGEGRNRNENTWRLIDSRLEILDADGEIQNLFDYDASKNQFRSSRPARAFQIENQYIFRKAE